MCSVCDMNEGVVLDRNNTVPPLHMPYRVVHRPASHVARLTSRMRQTVAVHTAQPGSVQIRIYSALTRTGLE